MSPDIASLQNIRVVNPGKVVELAATRSRRPIGDRLMLIAADHPARGALSVGGRPMAMADRHELLARLVVALERPGVDGVLGTPDIIEDLLLLGALEDKVVIGSMNRGGLAGSTFEFDDRFTAYDPATLADMRFDGGKMLTRIAVDVPDTLRTLESAAHGIGELAMHGLMALVEPFWSSWVNGKVTHDLSADAVMRSITVVSGLGNTSRWTWLKLPVIPDMSRVMRSTTLPVLLLGGDPAGSPSETFASWETALQLPGVRGLVVGRALLYPSDDDVVGAVDTAASLVRTNVQAE